MGRFQVSEHLEVWREWCAQREHESSAHFPLILPYAALSLGCFQVTCFYNKLVMCSVFCEPLRQIKGTEKESMETSDLYIVSGSEA